MHIALISYEYPPDTAVGGIATYVQQAAACLVSRGHHVEVFAGSGEREGCEIENGIFVHRILLDQEKRLEFRTRTVAGFMDRHLHHPFDVIEGAEFAAEASDAAKAAPGVALVTKLHMGMFSIRQIEARAMGFKKRLRRRLGAMRRREPPFWHRSHPDHINEWRAACDADEIVAPCAGMTKWMQREWDLPENRLSVVPNPYLAAPELLAIPIDTDTKTVTFLGRQEIRKGVLDLFKAIPLFLGECPDWRVRFVGRPLASPIAGIDMATFGARQLAEFRDKVDFFPPVPLAEIAQIFSSTDLCVFPSLWENFPNVCLEAMSAGRGIVASSAGGMKDQLNDGECGLMVPPGKPRLLAAALARMASDRPLREKLARAARHRVQSVYSAEAVAPMIEASYLRAIIAHRSRRPTAALGSV